MNTAERLMILIEAAGYKQRSDFARAAGVEPGTLNQQIARNSIPMPALERYVRTARATGTTIDWVVTGRGNPPLVMAAPVPPPSVPVAPDMQKNVTERRSESMPVAVLPWDSIPVWRTAFGGGKMGEWIITDDIVGGVTRPPGLALAPEAFAMVVPDDLMAPLYRAGDTVYGDRARPAIGGEDCFLSRPIVNGTPKQSFALLIRTLVSSTLTHWRVRQFDPDKTYNVPKSDYPQAWKLMGKYSR